MKINDWKLAAGAYLAILLVLLIPGGPILAALAFFAIAILDGYYIFFKKREIELGAAKTGK